MKKLMALIGAVAMSFGLFAAVEGTYSSTSFERSDAGCFDGQTFDFSEATDWSTTSTDTFELVAQDVSALPYPAKGTRARRYEFFTGWDVNVSCLKLEIPADTLECEIGDNRRIFIDQLVKFSEYDNDPELVEDSKIAVWMKADDSGEIGLYASVGTGSQLANVQIAGNYEPDKWYRLTIKALGNVRNSGTQAGFLIYIDGGLVSIVEGDRDYLDRADDLTEDAAGYYARGRLFASMGTGSAEIATVGYTGYGEIDDLIISEEAPAFADDPYTFTIVPPVGLEVVSVEANGEELDEPYIVPPGTIVRITYKAAEGWKITSGTVYDDVEIDEDGKVIDTTDVKVAEIVARLSRGGQVIDYLEAELYDVITSLEDGDKVIFVQNADILDEDNNPVYSFTANTELAITDDDGEITWDVDGYNDNNGWAGVFIDCVDIEETKTIKAWFESEDGLASIQADVAGSLQVDRGRLAVESEIVVSGTMTAANIEIYNSLTLSGKGKVITQTDELEILTDEGDVEKLENTPEGGWFTYRIAMPAPSDYPPDWPDADSDVKAKFAAWREGVGKDADLATDEAKNAFLLNVSVDDIKELKIESIEVDAEGYAAIVVSAPGMFGLMGVDLGEINGVLSVEAGDTLDGMEPKAVAWWYTQNGKANAKIKSNFIKAVIGFQKPAVDAIEKPPMD